MKVRILLSQPLNGENYVEVVEACGAIADLQAYPEVNIGYDGLILCGGGDIEPSRFGEENNGSTRIDTRRDECEFALLDAYVKAGKPVLGICRGCQVINVYFGGTLIQHLDNFEQHRQEGDAIHGAYAVGDSVVRQLYGDKFTINSMHHQALKDIGEGLRVTHRSDIEGGVEGIEHNTLPIVAYQWHPERVCLGRKRENVVDGMKVIEHFIKTCEQYAK